MPAAEHACHLLGAFATCCSITRARGCYRAQNLHPYYPQPLCPLVPAEGRGIASKGVHFPWVYIVGPGPDTITRV